MDAQAEQEVEKEASAMEADGFTVVRHRKRGRVETAQQLEVRGGGGASAAAVAGAARGIALGMVEKAPGRGTSSPLPHPCRSRPATTPPLPPLARLAQARKSRRKEKTTKELKNFYSFQMRDAKRERA